jgi:hypothetical protein
MTENDDLRSRLRRADPAASLAPPAPYETSRLRESTMTTITPLRTTSTSTDRQRRFNVLVAAAFVLLAVAGGGWLTNRSTPPVPNAAKPAALVNLTGGGGAEQMCAYSIPTRRELTTAYDFVFAGTVTRIGDNVATLTVTRVYKGTKADEVRVGAADPISEGIMDSGQFEMGKKYLIASAHGVVNGCGRSGEANTPGLQEAYDNAF